MADTDRTHKPLARVIHRTGEGVPPAVQEDSLESLRARVQYLTSILDQSGDAIVCTDLESRVTEFNRGAEHLLGYKREEVLGKAARDFYLDPEDRQKILRLLAKKGFVTDYETRVRTKTGKSVHISITLSYLRDMRGKIIGTVGVSKDIRKRKVLQHKLKRLATADQLTGLFNRAHFNTRLQEEIDRARRLQRPLCLILLDLDGFKEYNDTRGHLAGDSVLRGVGRIILHACRKFIDSAFRYGGDEFTILLPDTPIEGAFGMGERIRGEIEWALMPDISVSIGVSELREAQDWRDFIRAADEAMYSAKTDGGNRTRRYQKRREG